MNVTMNVTKELPNFAINSFLFSFFPLQADFEKAINAIRHSAEQFRLYINRFDRWLIENHGKAIKIFQTFDTEHTGKVTYGQFKAGKLNWLCHSITIHINSSANGTVNSTEAKVSGHLFFSNDSMQIKDIHEIVRVSVSNAYIS